VVKYNLMSEPTYFFNYLPSNAEVLCSDVVF